MEYKREKTPLKPKWEVLGNKSDKIKRDYGNSHAYGCEKNKGRIPIIVRIALEDIRHLE